MKVTPYKGGYRLKKGDFIIGLGMVAILICFAALQIQPTSAANPKAVVFVANSSITKTGIWEIGEEEPEIEILWGHL